MEVVLELIFEIFGEFLIQLIFQALGLIGEHALQPYRKAEPRSPTASIISHVLIGAALGGLSLLIWRHSMIHGELARVAYLFLGPVLAGGLAGAIGWLLKRNNHDTVPLERFGYAYLFAFSLSGVRFLATM